MFFVEEIVVEIVVYHLAAIYAKVRFWPVTGLLCCRLVFALVWFMGGFWFCFMWGLRGEGWRRLRWVFRGCGRGCGHWGWGGDVC